MEIKILRIFGLIMFPLTGDFSGQNRNQDLADFMSHYVLSNGNFGDSHLTNGVEKNSILKGTISIITYDPVFNDCNARFTMVPSTICLIKYEFVINFYDFKN